MEGESKMNAFPIQIHKEKIESFCKKHHIHFFAFFGSVLTDRFKKNSDVDVLVKFQSTHTPHLLSFARMQSELSDIIDLTVDLKTPNDLSPYFRNEVLAKMRIIYGD